MIIDRKTAQRVHPAATADVDADGTPTGGKFMVYDSALSEFAAVGFEYGYSVGNPDALVLWEAQFGDFVNGAQSIIDEFISSGEAKWGQLSDVVLLLPHGHEGQGPDHTSARIERFLLLWAEGSMTIAMPSTPANYFHLLRRHGLDGIHRPLIVLTPKSMLRNKAAVSDIKDFTETEVPVGDRGAHLRGRHRRPQQGQADPADQRQDLLRVGGAQEQRRARRRRDRPYRAARSRCHGVGWRRPWTGTRTPTEYFWVQEEPANQGAWPTFGLTLPEVLPEEAVRHQTDLAARDVGAVVGFVEGARRRAAGDHRPRIRLTTGGQSRPGNPNAEIASAAARV